MSAPQGYTDVLSKNPTTSWWTIVVLLLAIAFFSGSCEYDPHQTDFTVVEPTRPPREAIFTFSGSEYGDTISVAGNANVHFRIKLGEFKIYKAEVFLDTNRIGYLRDYSPVDSIMQDIKFSYRFLEDGFYPLTIRAFFDTGELPLEDRILEKNNVIIRKWILHYTKKPPPPEVIFFGEEDGSLKFVWKKSDVVNFEHYTIEGREKSGYLADVRHTFQDRSDTAFDNRQYIGSGHQFRVFVSAGGEDSDPVELRHPYSPDFKIYTDENLQRVFSWKPTPFTGNFGCIEILYQDDVILSTTDPSDSCFILQDGILYNRRYWFKMIPEVHSNNAYIYAKNIDYHFTLDSFPSASYLANSREKPWYIYGTGVEEGEHRVFRHDPISGEIISRKLPGSEKLVISNNGKYLHNGIYIIDPFDLSYRDYNVKIAFGDMHEAESNSISNNGILSSNNFSFGFISDLKTGQPLQKLTSRNGQYGAYISPNSEYVVWLGFYHYRFDIWKYDSTENSYIRGESKLLGDDWHQSLLFDNDTVNSNFYHLRHENGRKFIERWSCERALKIGKFETEADYLLDIDPVNNHIVAYADTMLYIYDPGSGALLHKIMLDDNIVHDHNHPVDGKRISVVNSIVYSPLGKLDLKLYE